eukprot:CAMPEP_0175980506 /NCGR_PEP_ID=MMETSP0108-20121206/46826_1 /TAXON_ID=195067 ORGANISM="Goniomonas pacifica, Strain CCMP1869" /NCGR_SAMPLE_ID=MMETSP0108 /ASSEMBLY_ACC=CAM_ASM_000204 /LENGTH=40 /DNA_ID= /DNA_START= /DNA_END= /DNA_ORIENTATION=
MPNEYTSAALPYSPLPSNTSGALHSTVPTKAVSVSATALL